MLESLQKSREAGDSKDPHSQQQRDSKRRKQLMHVSPIGAVDGGGPGKAARESPSTTGPSEGISAESTTLRKQHQAPPKAPRAPRLKTLTWRDAIRSAGGCMLPNC